MRFSNHQIQSTNRQSARRMTRRMTCIGRGICSRLSRKNRHLRYVHWHVCLLRVSACVAQLKKKSSWSHQCGVTYRKDKAVLEVGELFVTLLAAVHSVVLVDHFLVTVLAGTGLVKTVLLAQVDYGSYAGVVVCLKREYKQIFILTKVQCRMSLERVSC